MPSPFNDLENRAMSAIRRYQMLRPGDVAGVAVSGGADSVAQLLLLQKLREALGIRLLVLHFNHQLRGAESDADEQFVSRLAAEHGLEFVTGREDVAARAREAGSNLEDAARKCRYDFFSALVRDGVVTRVCVGHTADDQAETVLAKIIRGTGPAGLAGIYPVAGHVVRPLISVRRAQLREFLLRKGQAWREDSTNLDESRLRARIRARLLPLLEQDFQPAIVSHLGQLANLCREDESFWTELAEERFREFVRREEDDTLWISIPSLLLPLDFLKNPAIESSAVSALTTRLIRRILAELKGDRFGITSRHVEDILHLATVSTSGHQLHLPSGISVEKSFDNLGFTRRRQQRREQSGNFPEAPNREYEFESELSLAARDDQSVDIPVIGLRLRLKVIDWPGGQRDTKHEAMAADWSRLRAPVVVRNSRPGDTFRFQGRLRDRKLKQLLSERRIALSERRSWPVLTSAGKLVWARGFPVADGFMASGKTRKALVISEEPI
jgi:tRNA(Ile)-lysidine synthase